MLCYESVAQLCAIVCVRCSTTHVLTPFRAVEYRIVNDDATDE